MNLLGIQRATRFSPHSEARDAAIFEAVVQCLEARGHHVSVISEEDWETVGMQSAPDGIFSMSRSFGALTAEAARERQEVPVWNSAAARLRWNRLRMNARCRELGIDCPTHANGNALPVHPPLPYPFWLKRDDETAQQAGDVRPVQNADEWHRARKDFEQAGVKSWVCEEHLQGDLIKFYGVAGTDFFHHLYPTADGAGFSKFGDEACNGRPQSLPFDADALKRQADRLAQAAGLCIYGGDAIVCPDGRCCLIDFNDWPSFAPCRHEAAQAIATRIETGAIAHCKPSKNTNDMSTNTLESTFKSQDTEEWLDIHFTRPIGLWWARLFNRFDVHPNVVTVLGIILGAAAGVMFYYPDLVHTLIGIALLVWANFYDSADGQLARMTGKKTRMGRILDGVAGDVWFISIYFFICLRLTPQWGWWIWALAAFSGLVWHVRQCQLADYYRNIHLYFLKGRSGSELDSYRKVREEYYEVKWRRAPVWKVFLYLYGNYTRSQEQMSPAFQTFYRKLKAQFGEAVPQALRDDFRRGSLPLMKYTNILTFNTRAIALYISLLVGEPWLYFVFECTVLNAIWLYMRHKHEALCRTLTDNLESYAQG